MSHFPVFVIGTNPEAQLAPFQENSMGTCPSELLRFVDLEAKYLEEYETGTRERVVMPDGRLLSPMDDEFKGPNHGFLNQDYRVPENLTRRQVPFKELFVTFEDFVRGYHGYTERDEKTGRYGHWENPNARWDWYMLGGRWTGFFKLRPGHEGECGEPGLGAEPAPDGTADQCLLEAIDVEGMRAEAQAKAAAHYDEVTEVIAGREVPSFESVLQAHAGDHAAARRVYWSTPVIKDLKDADFAWSIQDIAGVGREIYIERAGHRAMSAFAVVKDGVWYERGRMGWWACVADERDEDEWNRQVALLLQGLDPKTLVSVYDCHV